jgi:Tfp pilus assembly protein PilX
MRALARTTRRRLPAQDGFTMFVAMGVLLVTSLLLAAAFTAALSDSHLSRGDTTQKQSYFAALAGIQEYEYKLQANPDYWQTCEAPTGTVPGEGSIESYKITLLTASTSEGAKECSTSNTFKTMIESKGTLTNTFRVKSTGTATTTGYTGSATRSLVATFQVSGFLNYLYYTNFEQGDPPLFGSPKECEKKYYQEWSIEKGLSCVTIVFTNGDAVNGPFHTNDAAKIKEAPTFGRSGHSPADAVEMNGGIYSSTGTAAEKAKEKCKGTSAKFYTTSECFSEGATLVAPETDTSLGQYVEKSNEFVGATHLVLNGATEKITVTYYEENVKEELEKKTKEIPWPSNGLIYVKASTKKACSYEYKYWNSDNAEEEKEEKSCGNVYVHGTYTKSLTVAGENDLVIDGNISPTGLSLGSEPSGNAVMGLIASHYVRIYHPLTGVRSSGSCLVSENLKPGSLENPWIYAAILATAHSWVVDNYDCGTELGKLHVYGAIAQNYRGPVGTTGGTGYIKDYKYDERLAVDEPPYFLSPFKSGWKVIRETAPAPG